MYRKMYAAIRSWFEKKEYRLKLLKFSYFWMPRVVVLGYVICILLGMLCYQKQFWKLLLVPAGLLFAASLLRHAINLPRPYESAQIQPLIYKETQGHSFPSKHTVSAGIIGMAWLSICVPAGVFFLVLAALIAVSRVCAGVHYVRDVAAGYLLAVVVGTVGFFL